VRDYDSVMQDAFDDDQRIIDDNSNTEFLEFPECINLDINARINQQLPQVQNIGLVDLHMN